MYCGASVGEFPKFIIGAIFKQYVKPKSTALFSDDYCSRVISTNPSPNEVLRAIYSSGPLILRLWVKPDQASKAPGGVLAAIGIKPFRVAIRAKIPTIDCFYTYGIEALFGNSG
jgi:hypothetical protein